METINFQCGHCGQVMAVSTSHLGIQVHCPHCQQIVQVPTAAPPVQVEPPSPAAYGGPGPGTEPESIFTSPEESHTDDLFGAPPRAVVEMPGPSPVVPTPAPAPPLSPTMEEQPPVPAAGPGWAGESTIEFPSQPGGGAPAHPSLAGEPLAESPTEEAMEPVSRPRTSSGRGSLVPILLIFLIPYSVVATGFIAWLLYMQSQRYDPMKYLRDQNPRDGGPERIKHDAPLSKELKTKLRQPIQIGELAVTPLKVELSAEGDLVLHLKMRNTSQDLRFNPMPDSFLRFNRSSMTAPKPYTFLQKYPERFGDQRFYGGDPEYWNGSPGKGQKSDGLLDPGKEMVALLHTANSRGYRQEVQKIAASSGQWLWRVQVRRGFMQVDNKDVSVTAVIGVEFAGPEIERGNKPAG